MKNLEKPNFTAWFVLQGLIAAMHQPAFMGDINEKSLYLRKMLARAASEARFLSWIFSLLPYHWQYRIGQWVTDSGRLRHFHLRKKEIETQTRALLKAGVIKQMVVLGSGLDVLPMTLAENFPDVNFIEIDVDGTQTFKQSVFAAHQVAAPPNIEPMMGDLRNPLAEVLKISKEFAANAPTLWLAEGFLMFLPEASVQQIFESVRAISATGSYFMVTTLSQEISSTPSTYLIQNLYLKKEKTPFKWCIAPEKVADYIYPMGYSIIRQFPYTLLHEPYHSQNSKLPAMQESITLAQF